MLYIPTEISVLFRDLKNSFTGKEAFITYKKISQKIKNISIPHKIIDDFSNLVNSKKVEEWISKTTPNPEVFTYNNSPKSGFVINKHLQKSHHYLGQINTILVYHPDGFEFQISISNLMNILETNNIISQELQGEFVLGWFNNYPYLLSTTSKYYNANQEYSKKLLPVNDFKKDLVPGRKYFSKTEKNLIYIGNFVVNSGYFKDKKISNKISYIFFDNCHQKFISLIKCEGCYGEEIVENIDDLIEKFNNLNEASIFDSKNSSIVHLSKQSTLTLVEEELEELIFQQEHSPYEAIAFSDFSLSNFVDIFNTLFSNKIFFDTKAKQYFSYHFHYKIGFFPQVIALNYAFKFSDKNLQSFIKEKIKYNGNDFLLHFQKDFLSLFASKENISNDELKEKINSLIAKSLEFFDLCAITYSDISNKSKTYIFSSPFYISSYNIDDKIYSMLNAPINYRRLLTYANIENSQFIPLSWPNIEQIK